tara:strand:+ start:174 stop:1343 length:1170 start_codon:yes stop_codon:yes gene_type:complete
MYDDYGAFMPGERLRIEGSANGPLTGKTFAAKDVFDVAGHPTSNGHPMWRETHPLPNANSSAVDLLLSAGASLYGKTVCDEMCYSLAGDNVHYGSPINPTSPSRSIGGSSSGSAAAVAGDLVDFALGTDCGGSVRCPASFAGIYGIRPTHGRVDADGVVPLANSFDVVGWLAKDPSILRAVGSVLLLDESLNISPTKAIFAEDAFARLPAADRAIIEIAASKLIKRLGLETIPLQLAREGLDHWYSAFQHLQALEIWGEHANWIKSKKPSFGHGVRERFAYAAKLATADRQRYQPVRANARERINTLLADGNAIIIMPTAPISPKRKASGAQVEDFRRRTMGLTCPAGLSGCPQVSLPLADAASPIGVSILGPQKSDEILLKISDDMAT